LAIYRIQGRRNTRRRHLLGYRNLSAQWRGAPSLYYRLLKKSHPIGPLPDGTNSCHGTGQTITNGTVKPHNTRPTALAYFATVSASVLSPQTRRCLSCSQTSSSLATGS